MRSSPAPCPTDPRFSGCWNSCIVGVSFARPGRRCFVGNVSALQPDETRAQTGGILRRVSERRGAENLLQTRMLRRLAGVKLAADEVSAAMALSQMRAWDATDDAERQRLMTAFVRTATTFVLSSEDAPAYGSQLMDMAWEPWDGLPPLPYPRMWIECGAPTESDPVPFPLIEPSAEPDWASGLWGVGITGDQNGWVIAELYCDPWDRQNNGFIWPWDAAAKVDFEFHRVTPDGKGFYPIPDVDESIEGDGDRHGDQIANAMSAWATILMVQLIDVLGSRRVPMQIPRQTRRAHERKFGVAHPSVYFVDLDATGEDKLVGSGDRQYHHRWMVRGHWRIHSDGRRSWVRPYVKGPKGAPWKGRPVYAQQRATRLEEHSGASS
jgi:hypothetical protein